MNGGCSRRRPLGFLARPRIAVQAAEKEPSHHLRKDAMNSTRSLWLGQCSSGSRLRYVHTSYNQDVVQEIIFERYWSASKLSFGRL